MLNRYLVFLTALFALSANVTPALAQPLNNSPSEQSKPSLLAQNHSERWKNKKYGFGGRFLDELNLSDRQKNDIKAIHDEYKVDMTSLREELRTQQQQLRDMMIGDSSRREIEIKHDNVASLHSEMSYLRFQSMLDMREVLTPVQRRKLAQLMDEYRDNMRSRFERRSRDE